MQAIAEFVMRSKAHAIGTSVIASVLPLLGWLSSVIVALVSLRQGGAAGLTVLMWTLLPLMVSFYLVGDPFFIVLICTFVMAVLLRQTLSWELVLLASVLFAGICALLFNSVAGEVITTLAENLRDQMEGAGGEVALSVQQMEGMAVAALAWFVAFSAMVTLLIARWCQSALYNPGGFKKEFRLQRMSQASSLILILGMVLCYQFSEALGYWMPLLAMPVVFRGLGLVHWLIARELSEQWIFGFYISFVLSVLLVFPFVIFVIFIMSLAFVDSMFNVRQKIELIQKD